MKKIWLATTIVLALSSAAFTADTVVEEIIARINNSIISRTDLAKAREAMIAELKQKGGPGYETAATAKEKDVLRDLIDQQLLVQKAGDLGITGDTELIKRLDEIRKSMNLESMEDLEKAATQQGVSYEDFKSNLRNSILTQAVISREVGSHLQMTNEEATKYYDDHKAQMERPEQVALSEILIAPVQSIPGKETEGSATATPEQIDTAKQKAEGILEQLKKGAKFEELAEKNSNGPTAAQGGDLGYFRRGTLSKELENKAFAMKKGETTDVIQTRQGFVILKVTEHDQAGIPEMKEVLPNIQEALYLQKLQPALRAYLTKLREEAYIDIKPGYIDTSASPNQTNPILTASADDSGTGEKAKKKKRFLVF